MEVASTRGRRQDPPRGRFRVKMMATGLAAGILLDATVIRALIVPAVIALMGRWNWWLPSWPARLLRVRPSPLADAGASR